MAKNGDTLIFLVSGDILNAVVRNCAKPDDEPGCYEYFENKCICDNNLCNDHCDCNSAATKTQNLFHYNAYTLLVASLAMLTFRLY